MYPQPCDFHWASILVKEDIKYSLQIKYSRVNFMQGRANEQGEKRFQWNMAYYIRVDVL